MSDVKPLDRGESEGLDSLYRRYSAWLQSRLRAHVTADQAADVVQETYLRAAPYRQADIRHPKSFLLRIALNLVRDQSRRGRRGREFESEVRPPEGQDAAQIDQILLKQIIMSMPPLYRDVFVLNRFGGMTYAEIAASLGLKLKTVEWRMSKALEHCVARLDD